MDFETALPAAGAPSRQSRRAQLWVLCRQELRQRLTGLWSLAPLLLAFGPALMLLLVILIAHLLPGDTPPGAQTGGRVGDLADWQQAFAEIFHSLMLRVCVFFGCAAVFLNSFRSPIAGRYLHYNYLSPVPRESVALAKYLSGLLFAGTLFALGSLAMWAAIHLDGPLAETLPALLSARGLRLGFTYAAIAALACMGYGAVFMALGLRLRNPIFPTLLLMGWEAVNLFLPAALQKLSIIHHLQSLGPIPVNAPLISVVAAPTPAPQALLGLLVVTALLVALSLRWARGLELDYGGEG